MSRVPLFMAAALAFMFFPGPAFAAHGGLIQPKPAVPSLSPLQAAATGQALYALEYTDFDAFSSVNDPLYREGSKQLLQQEIKDEKALQAKKPALRDAPISKDAVKSFKKVRPLKKARVKKTLRSDPVKPKSSL